MREYIVLGLKGKGGGRDFPQILITVQPALNRVFNSYGKHRTKTIAHMMHRWEKKSSGINHIGNSHLNTAVVVVFPWAILGYKCWNICCGRCGPIGAVANRGGGGPKSSIETAPGIERG